MTNGDSDSWTGTIESISHEGYGVGIMEVTRAGKTHKRPIFVPYTVPGDELVAEIVEKKRKYTFGKIKELLNASKERTEAPCPHFTTCGGCNLEHVSYDEQLRQKAKQVQFLLERKGIALPKDIEILPSNERHNYRWKSKVAVLFAGGKCVAGFRKFRSNEIVPVQQCFIVHKKILEFIQLLNKKETTLECEQEMFVAHGESGKLAVLVNVDEARDRNGLLLFLENLYAENRGLIGNVFIVQQHTVRTLGQVQEHLTYSSNSIRFTFFPETFIQANIATNTLLVEKTCELVGRVETALDLYAGIGNFSLPMAKHVQKVIAVEGNHASVLAGSTNALRNSIENVEFIQSSAEAYLRTAPAADVVLLDPPRTGCSPSVMKGLLQLQPEKIVYVSCNPATLARDLDLLQYDVTDIFGVDMFPDTSHVEMVVQLSHKLLKS
ncbi:MAG: 23S rRNA (uracil(1939)-C(5))-methyltransferase RlmD [Candidatus Woesearchaeota archaeon]|nr:23S rRNA (uracil(1939)-C(5))-methyltransferase RlmD [Candidatus Woesearchaeota archaeon]